LDKYVKYSNGLYRAQFNVRVHFATREADVENERESLLLIITNEDLFQNYVYTTLDLTSFMQQIVGLQLWLQHLRSGDMDTQAFGSQFPYLGVVASAESGHSFIVQGQSSGYIECLMEEVCEPEDWSSIKSVCDINFATKNGELLACACE
jgi:hypothetical protein